MKFSARLSLLLAIISAGFLAGCGPGGTTTGNPLVTLKSAPYSSSLARFGIPFISEAHAAVSSISLCFKRLRFKTTDAAGTSENYDLNLGMVALSSSGNTLGSVAVPAGTYRRIEFDLDDHCGTGASVSFWNNANYSTRNGISVRFEGEFTASADGDTVTLDFQALIDALNTVTSSDDIRNALETVSGEF